MDWLFNFFVALALSPVVTQVNDFVDSLTNGENQSF